MTKAIDTVIIIGSGPNAPDVADTPRGANWAVLAINNAWRIRPDWDYVIHPEDFPEDRWPATLGPAQTVITAHDYVDVQNDYGGFVYAGGTMAFTAGYWALGALRPKTMAFIGCDMVYPTSGTTHFYGTGTADPLRADVTLQSLEAKSARLFMMAARQGCQCVNLSNGESRLVFPRADVATLTTLPPQPDPSDLLLPPLGIEAELGYFVRDGRYWKVEDSFDPAKLRALDAMWLEAFAATGHSVPVTQ